MTKNYRHLLEPLQIGSHLLKSRITTTPSSPSYIQEHEKYPTEGLIQHYVNKARGGAALITCNRTKLLLQDESESSSIRHPLELEIEGTPNNYIAQMTEGVHAFDSFITLSLNLLYPSKYDFSTGILSHGVPCSNIDAKQGVEITIDAMKECIANTVMRAKLAKECGFDGIYLHMAYQLTLLGRSLSFLTNKRTDEYGGSFENRIRFPLEVCKAVKDACGEDFIIEACLTGEERDVATGEPIPGGWTIDDTGKFALAGEGLIDILHIRGWDMDIQHCTGLYPKATLYTDLAAAVKEYSPRMKILTVSGYQDPAFMDEVIASGKADLIGMARGFVSNSDFGIKVAEDRADDIVPCIRCNKCFRVSPDAPYTSRCSVNPIFGMEHRYRSLITVPAMKKRVAVVGGGPAGMEAALVCRDRGHDVTLFEKSGRLGGQIVVSDYASFKWPLKKFKDYLIYQLDKKNVDVRLNTLATPRMIDEGNYDVVFLAMGSRPKMPEIPGIDGSNVRAAIDVFGHEDELAHKVVIVGGGENGVETGMHLAERGHDVTVIDMREIIASDAPPIHMRVMLEAAWKKLENFHPIVNALVNSISANGVTYSDKNTGESCFVEAGSVVIAVGAEPLAQEAIDFTGCHGRIFIVGDNHRAGSVMELMRDSYFAASQV